MHIWNLLKYMDRSKTCSACRHSKNIAFCKEEWGRIPKGRIERLLAGYIKHLEAVVSVKGGVTKYWLKGFPNFSSATYIQF